MPVLPTPGGSDIWGAALNAAIKAFAGPDSPPSSPNAKDDEFDGSSSVTWTSTPTAPNAWDINTTAKDCGYLKVDSGAASAAYVGKYQSTPATPFTITTKVSSTCRGNYQRGGGIFIGPASPTATSGIVYLGHIYHTTYQNRALMRVKALFNGSSPTNTTPTMLFPAWGCAYLRLVVSSATSVSSYGSFDGRAWFLIESGLNPGFTPGVMGVCANEEGTAGPVEAYFDYFRVT